MPWPSPFIASCPLNFRERGMPEAKFPDVDTGSSVSEKTRCRTLVVCVVAEHKEEICSRFAASSSLVLIATYRTSCQLPYAQLKATVLF